MQATATQQEKKNKIIGYVGTALVHILIFLLLWFIILAPPDPPIQYEGMGLTMALGTPDAGGESPVPVEEPMPTDPTPPVEQEEQPIATQETEQTPVVAPKPKEVKPTEIKKPVEPIEKPRVPEANSQFKKRDKTASNQDGFGDNKAPGNQGDENGEPGGDPNGGGRGNTAPGAGGNGSGIGFELAGRSMVKKPTIEDNTKETGKVVIDIEVDRTGRVVNARLARQGTTNPALIPKALQAAKETKFSANAKAEEIQYGKLTIYFRLKP
jgi:protein TonB